MKCSEENAKDLAREASEIRRGDGARAWLDTEDLPPRGDAAARRQDDRSLGEMRRFHAGSGSVGRARWAHLTLDSR
jgi:hypothetical protein